MSRILPSSWTSGVSVPTLKAFGEVLAWPLVATESLRLGRHDIGDETLSPELQVRLSAHGVAEPAPDHLSRAWSQGQDILAGLRHHAKTLLCTAHEGWRLVTDPRVPGREILKWRFISLCLPVGLLLAATTKRGARPALRVDLLPRSVEPSDASAHLHIHVGAASSFEGLWSNFMSRRIPGSREFRGAVKGAIMLPRGISQDEWLGLLTRAALVRRILKHLSLEWALSIDEGIARAYGEEPDFATIRRAVDELAEGKVQETTTLREALLRKLAAARPTAASSQRGLESLDDLWQADTIADGYPWPEGRMMALLFDRLEDIPNARLAGLFVQYLRIKSMLYRLLVHYPTEGGLSSFSHTFKQKSPYRTGLEMLLPEFCLSEAAISLRGLEVRNAPPPTTSEIRLQCKNLIKLADQREEAIGYPIEVGWIFHFIRDPKEPKSAKTGARYSSLYRAIGHSARVLRRALCARPRELLPVIRGLDLAGVEREGPLWVALPHLLGLRDLSDDICAQTDLAPLHVTLHVGEDFLHLASGLRAVHEPFVWGLMQRGDRLGHALALGLDADNWCRSHPIVTMPRWERILDLSWMIAALTDRLAYLRISEDLPGLALARMHDELRVHAERCHLEFGPDSFVDLFTRDLGARGSLPRLLDLGYTPGRGDPLYLLHQRLLGSSAVQGRLDELVEVETAGENNVLTELSRGIASMIGLMQIAIEVNPTSNLLIGGLEHPLQQPIFQLHPLDGDHGTALPITLNADDPLTFATNLSDEIAYTWAALTLTADVAPGYARAWIAEAARTSWNARFTLPRPTTTDLPGGASLRSRT